MRFIVFRFTSKLVFPLVSLSSVIFHLFNFSANISFFSSVCCCCVEQGIHIFASSYSLERTNNNDKLLLMDDRNTRALSEIKIHTIFYEHWTCGSIEDYLFTSYRSLCKLLLKMAFSYLIPNTFPSPRIKFQMDEQLSFGKITAWLRRRA